MFSISRNSVCLCKHTIFNVILFKSSLRSSETTKVATDMPIFCSKASYILDLCTQKIQNFCALQTCVHAYMLNWKNIWFSDILSRFLQLYPILLEKYRFFFKNLNVWVEKLAILIWNIYFDSKHTFSCKISVITPNIYYLRKQIHFHTKNSSFSRKVPFLSKI